MSTSRERGTVVFGGSTFSQEHDGARLTRQLDRVFKLMSDGKWRTLREILHHVGGSEAGISARLRDLRKERFGGYRVDRRRRREAQVGLWEYSLVRSDRPAQLKLMEGNQ